MSARPGIGTRPAPFEEIRSLVRKVETRAASAHALLREGKLAEAEEQGELMEVSLSEAMSLMRVALARLQPAPSAKSTTTTTGTAIRVNGRDFIVTEIRDGKGKDAGWPVYILSGKRGAKYATCRNVHHPEMMFLVSERGFGIPAGWERVWLTDASGALVAGGS